MARDMADVTFPAELVAENDAGVVGSIGRAGDGLKVNDGLVGIARTRWVDVAHATLPVAATSGVLTYTDPVCAITVDSIALAAGSAALPVAGGNYTIRYAYDAGNDTEAGILLPVAFPSGNASTERYQIGSFNVQPTYLGYDAATDIVVITLPKPIEIPITSDGVSRLDFAHNLGAGVVVTLGVRARRVD